MSVIVEHDMGDIDTRTILFMNIDVTSIIWIDVMHHMRRFLINKKREIICVLNINGYKTSK